jgi:hypothetical protein
MPTISFNAGTDFTINNISGSGIGFYGSGFGYSVPVGQYPVRAFITNSAGSTQGPEIDNNRYVSSTGVIIGQTGTPILLTQLPNYLSTLNIRFSNTTAVSVQNAELRIYDRSGINNNPTGVTCYVAEVIHTGTAQVTGGLGDATWQNIRGSTNILSLQNSPGLSGLTPGSTGTIHDWFIALSPSPDSIGSKTAFGLYFSCEYL